jgi:hypothetical protein
MGAEANKNRDKLIKHTVRVMGSNVITELSTENKSRLDAGPG